MSQHFYPFMKRLIKLIMGASFFFLLYFWTAQLRYSALVTGSSLTLPVAIRYGEVHWHGPSLLLLTGVGALSSFTCCLTFWFLLPWLRKHALWVRSSLCLLWLLGIALLGFFMPHFSLL